MCVFGRHLAARVAVNEWLLDQARSWKKASARGLLINAKWDFVRIGALVLASRWRGWRVQVRRFDDRNSAHAAIQLQMLAVSFVPRPDVKSYWIR